MSRRKRSGKKKFLIVIAVIIVLFGGICHNILNTKAVDPNNTEIQSFSIYSGASTKSIAASLEECGLIRNKIAFVYYVKHHGYDGKLRVGNYRLSASMSIEEITDALLKGIGETIKFTIPEGYCCKDIAQYFAKEGLMSEEEFWDLAANGDFSQYEFLNGRSKDIYRLEGYLFPDTYVIGVNSAPEKIIRVMLDRFQEVMTQLPENKSGLSFDEMIILASLVESEAKLDTERADIASVYINRLHANMLLQCDATVIYAMPERKEEVLYSDLKTDSPYNTYLYSGLPPTAICNPGLESLKAACQPADTSYYYYLWSKDEAVGHVFANDYEGHLKNRKTYGY